MQENMSKQVAVEVRTFVTANPMIIDGEVVNSPYLSGLDNMRQAFLDATRKLVFRTIESVTVSDEDRLETYLMKPTSSGMSVESYKFSQEPKFTEDEELRMVERHAQKFFCLTKSSSLRPGTPGEIGVKNQNILLKSENYAELDFFENMDFKFTRGGAPRINTILPVVGDIVCILANEKARKPEAKHWFVCSPQFLRTWTLIHYKEHDSIKKLVAPKKKCDVETHIGEEVVRQKVFSGNHTMTNSYLGWLLACYQNGLVSEEEELRNKFWCLRTEMPSRVYIHAYSALVLMLRYAECPGPNNVPNKLDDGPKFQDWYYHTGWLQNLFKKYELELHPDPAVRFVEVPVRSMTLPKGTRPDFSACELQMCLPEEDENSDPQALEDIIDVSDPNSCSKLESLGTEVSNWGDCVVDEIP